MDSSLLILGLFVIVAVIGLTVVLVWPRKDDDDDDSFPGGRNSRGYWED